VSVGRHVERSYPYLGAAISIPGWIYLLRWLNLSNQEAKDLFSVILNVSAIAAGFLGTAASVLLTMGPAAVIKDLKDSGSLGLLYRYLIAAIRHQFCLVLLSVVLILLYPKVHCARVLGSLAVVWGISVTLAGLSSFRIIHLFGKIITTD
jgi:hypothetical protein